jgi:hypothetical protein
VSLNYIDINNQVLKALGLEGKPVSSLNIHFEAGRVPQVQVILDLGFDETGDQFIREICRYELVERTPDEQVDR